MAKGEATRLNMIEKLNFFHVLFISALQFLRTLKCKKKYISFSDLDWGVKYPHF